MDWHQENPEPVGHEEDGTEEAVTMQTAEHAEDYADEEHEACQEQSYVLHEDPASYSEHHEDHADGDVQSVLFEFWQVWPKFVFWLSPRNHFNDKMIPKEFFRELLGKSCGPPHDDQGWTVGGNWPVRGRRLEAGESKDEDI